MLTQLNRQLKRVAAIGFFATVLCLPTVVGAVAEVEPNDTQSLAPVLDIDQDGSAGVTASLGLSGEATTTDVDIYAFDARAGDVPVIVLDANGRFDAILYLYDSFGNLLNSNDDAYPPTEGDACLTDFLVPCDPRIDLQPIGTDGRYYIAVGSSMRFMTTNFEVHPSFLAPQPGGEYELLVQGISPPPAGNNSSGDAGDNDDTVIDEPDVMTVMITTLRHGKKYRKGKKRKQRHIDAYQDGADLGVYNGWKTIKVAIHSTDDFNAVKDIDRDSLTFGATGDEDSLLKCRKKGKKVHLDGVKDHRKDLVCYFRPDRTNLVAGDMSATLKGRTKDGQEIAGSGILRVFRLPTTKTLNWYERHDLDPHERKPKRIDWSKKRKKWKELDWSKKRKKWKELDWSKKRKKWKQSWKRKREY